MSYLNPINFPWKPFLNNEELFCVSPKTIRNFIKPATTYMPTSTSLYHYTLPTTFKKPTVPPAPPAKTSYVVINILFVYSKEALATYNNEEQLIADNKAFCSLSAGIFTENSNKYIVYVDNVYNYLMPNMQQGKPCLFQNEIVNLMDEYIEGNYKYLPINRLKQTYRANVVVFIPVAYCTKCLGASPNVGFSTPREACLTLARGLNTNKISSSLLRPTLLVHELGHLLGCSHPLEPNAKPNPALVPGYGHHIISSPTTPSKNARNGTVMSYAPARIPYFSNPNLFKYLAPDQNSPCGLVGVAEAYKVIESNLPSLAASV